MTYIYVIILVASATLFSLTTGDGNLNDGVRDAKLISTFQIVRFPNDACTGSSATRNGTCYTSAECSDKGGTSQGSCADGFGVCCIFVIDGCGESSSENITYWDAPSTVASGDCKLTINPLNDNVCQLRLDFLTFVITGPSTSITTEVNIGNGGSPGGTVTGLIWIGTSAASDQASWTTNCLTDSFSVSSPNPANKPPVLCGTNSGFHMYVDMDSDTSNVLTFIFQEKPGPASALQDSRGIVTLASRDWDMTIMQYDCGYINRAPVGCTQWLWSDEGTQIGGLIQTYNFQGAAGGSKHLANQNQKICIRREKAICWAGFYMALGGTFELSGITTGGLALVPLTQTAAGYPCGYASSAANGVSAEGVSSSGYDCVIIPGLFGVAANNAANANLGVTATLDVNASAAIVRLGIASATNHSPAGPQISGSGVFGVNAQLSGLSLIAGDNVPATLFTQHVPFQVTFKSDGWEGRGVEAEQLIATNSVGMSLSYDLIPCSA